MEKISAPAPLALTNSKALTEISPTNTTKGPMLSMKLDSMSKLAESSVRVNVPARANFKKSNTCGSLYAKCNCRNHHETAAPLISDCDKVRPKSERLSRKAQSFSHPDTPVIFTEENRYPVSFDSPNRLRASQETVFKNGDQKVEIKHSKRSSSPNIREFSASNVEIHPEFKVQIVPKTSVPADPRPNRKPILKKGSKSFPSATRSFRFDSTGADRSFSSAYSVDESEEQELSEKVSSLIVDDFDSSSPSLSSPTTTIVEVYQSDAEEKPSNSPKTLEPITAEKFFQESGILGPMGSTVSSILKKSSKIKPVLTDSLTKEKIRKTSLVLFGQTCNEARKKRSISESYAEHPILKKEEFETLSLSEEIFQLRETIRTRDDEIKNLKREIHKLKSVLQQQARRNLKCECNFSSLQASVGTTTSGQRKEPSDSSNEAENLDNNKKSSTSSLVSVPVRSNVLQQQHIIKKQGVSGECCDMNIIGSSSDILIRKFEKDFKSKQQIKDAVLDNDFLKHLDSVQIRELVESMYGREVEVGEFIVRENEPGNHLFVSAEGEFEIIVNDKVLGTLPAGKAFGELAILYNCRRTASIRAVRPNSRVWVLDRRAFQQIMMRTGLQRIEENVRFLKSVPLLHHLDNDVLAKIADVLELEFYPEGAYIIRQGTVGDNFFLISQGSVRVTQKIPGRSTEEEIRILDRGDYFGEQSLIKEDKRSANIIAMSPGVECLTLDRESFKQHIGDLEELHEKDYGDKDRIYALRQTESRQIRLFDQAKEVEREYANIDFRDLKTLATVGIGGFGRVLLVKHGKSDAMKVFALKQMKKVHILETKQEEHVFNERRILLNLSSPFICRLYRTYRDAKFIYLLLEACLGGEVWTVLRNQGRFSETTAQFIVGCVLEAFEFLHSRGIIYRDLKPENLMLAANGYVKLVDFGFAKQIGYSSKTWTFCGTPEYVAPEIILNKGHDKAVDYWALGVLISELITGAPPFTANDPLKTYNIILKGIDAIEYPRYVSRSAVSLIKKLCRDCPADRLGYQRYGIEDIKKHRWFQGFDWESLSNLTLKPPRITQVNGPLDLSNFDTFSSDFETPPDETSGWDVEF